MGEAMGRILRTRARGIDGFLRRRVKQRVDEERERERTRPNLNLRRRDTFATPHPGTLTNDGVKFIKLFIRVVVVAVVRPDEINEVVVVDERLWRRIREDE